MEKKQTAVDFMVEQLNKSIGLTKFVDTCDEEYKQEILGIIEQALAMEKEQIKDAFNNGMNNSVDYFDGYVDEDEQYYNETYKS